MVLCIFLYSHQEDRGVSESDRPSCRLQATRETPPERSRSGGIGAVEAPSREEGRDFSDFY